MQSLNQLVTPTLRLFEMSALNATDDLLSEEEENEQKRKQSDIRAGGAAHTLTPEKREAKRGPMYSADDMAILVQKQVEIALQV